MYWREAAIREHSIGFVPVELIPVDTVIAFNLPAEQALSQGNRDAIHVVDSGKITDQMLSFYNYGAFAACAGDDEYL